MSEIDELQDAEESAHVVCRDLQSIRELLTIASLDVEEFKIRASAILRRLDNVRFRLEGAEETLKYRLEELESGPE